MVSLLKNEELLEENEVNNLRQRIQVECPASGGQLQRFPHILSLFPHITRMYK